MALALSHLTQQARGSLWESGWQGCACSFSAVASCLARRSLYNRHVYICVRGALYKWAHALDLEQCYRGDSRQARAQSAFMAGIARQYDAAAARCAARARPNSR